MNRLVNGVETDLQSPEGVEIVRLADRMVVRTPEGADSAVAIRDGDAILVSYRGRQYRIEKASAKRSRAGAVTDGRLVAPMPAQVVDVLLKQGAKIKKGDRILVLEAMKVQQVYAAPFDGVLKSVSVKQGQTVEEGAVLAVVELGGTG